MMVVMLVVVEESFVWMFFFGALWQNRSKAAAFVVRPTWLHALPVCAGGV